MENQLLRIDLNLIPNTYFTLESKEIGFWKKEKIYSAKFFLNGRHFYTINSSQSDTEEDIKLFCNHYSTLFKIADRPFWKFSLNTLESELIPFVHSDLFKDMCSNLGGGYNLTFNESDGDFNLINKHSTQKGFIIGLQMESHGEVCDVFIKNPQDLHKTSYNQKITRNCGELFLAIIRELTILSIILKKREKIPYILNTSFFSNTTEKWNENLARGRFSLIMDEIYNTGHYVNVHQFML